MTLFYIITAVRCSVCKAKNLPTIDEKTGKKMVQKFGFYRRKSDSKRIQRYHCLRCNHTFSAASKDPAYHQNKRRLNYKILIKTLGGDLTIRFRCDSKKSYSQIYLEGEINRVFEGHIELG